MSLHSLTAADLVRIHGPRRVLDNVSLNAAPGERVGLIGENGVGKSTLLRILAGAEEPDAGTVQRPADLGFLPQQLPYEPAATVQSVVDDALRDSHDLLSRLDEISARMAGNPEEAGLIDEYGTVLEAAQDHDSWDADRRADLVLIGLGLADVPRERPLAQLSGGQRARLALGALLIRRPAALLLDEPTNHLDDDASSFLEAELQKFTGVVVVVSHDRAFLDAVCTDLVDLDPARGGPSRFGGTYSQYQEHRRTEFERWKQRYADEQDELAELRRATAVTARAVAHGRAPRDSEKMGQGHTAGRVQNQISRRVRAAQRDLDDLSRNQVRKPPEPLRFRSPTFAPATAAGTAVSLRDVDVDGRLHVDRLDIASTDHLLLTGPNGAGKSTLLGVLVGEVPTCGEVSRRAGLRVGYLRQDTVFDRPDWTARQTFAEAVGPRAEQVPLHSLGLLAARDHNAPVGALSVGQQRRLALAIVLADPPDLLLLDEPTNHLSPLLADQLQDALDGAAGALVVASHDRWLRRRWQGRTLQLPTALVA